jgi:hypothetical protein
MANIEETEMSLSTDQVIADMSGWTELKAYFEGIRGNINADLNAAELRVGDTAREFWVDQVNGDNTNDGSVDAPLQTINNAVNKSVQNGLLMIRLKADYHHTTNLYFRNGGIVIRSDMDGVQRTVTFAPEASPGAVITARFANANTSAFFNFRDLKLVACTGGANVVDGHMISGHGFTGVLLENCEIELPVGSDQSLINPIHACGLTVKSTIYPAEMAGRWMVGIPASSNPRTYTTVAYTNLGIL